MFSPALYFPKREVAILEGALSGKLALASAARLGCAMMFRRVGPEARYQSIWPCSVPKKGGGSGAEPEAQRIESVQRKSAWGCPARAAQLA